MIFTALKSYFACAWSAASYLVWGMPADKPSYWCDRLGFTDLTAPEYAESLAAYGQDPSFHRLKDILVEWTDAWPQRAAKLLALFGCLLAVGGVVVGTVLGALLFFIFG